MKKQNGKWVVLVILGGVLLLSGIAWVLQQTKNAKRQELIEEQRREQAEP